MTAATDFYIGAGNRIFRDVQAGPDSSVFVPAWVSTLTPKEVEVIMSLAATHPLRVGLQQAYAEGGNPLLSADMQALHTAAYNQEYPTTKTYGKGIRHTTPPGVRTVSALLVSRWSRITNLFSKGTSILQLKHGVDSTPDALIKYRTDHADQNSMSSVPELDGLQLYGDRTSLTDTEKATLVEHGIWLPEYPGGPSDKTSGLTVRSVWANGFNGDGARIDRFNNQIRTWDWRLIDNKGMGLRQNRVSDSKHINPSFGRNEEGQWEFTDCPSPQIICFDAWNPNDGQFTGLYAGNWISCANYRLAFGEFEGIMNIEGTNSDAGDSARYVHHNGLILGVTLKASLATYLGTQYVGGGGAIAYDQICRIKAASGVHFAFTCVARGDFDKADTRLPKYVWDVSKKTGGLDSERGFITVTSPDLIDADRDEVDDKVSLGFRVHWAKDPSSVVWRTHKPGQLLILPTATAQANLLMLTGSPQTLLRRLYPLCYLGMDDTRVLTGGNNNTTFDVPAAAGTLPTGYSYFIVLW